jgi:hypothetical protein
MTLPVVLTHEARRISMRQRTGWYEQKTGRGAEFTARIREVLNRIGQMPE